MQPKFIASLTFRGFNMLPKEVEALVGFAASTFGHAGTQLKTGTVALQRSFVKWELQFDDSIRLDEMIPTLINGIGGSDHLATVRQKVMPEFLEVDIAMWIKNSEVQEGGFIDLAALKMLTKVGATLGLGFYARSSQ